MLLSLTKARPPSCSDWVYTYSHLDWLTGANNDYSVTALDETFVYLPNGSLSQHVKPAANDIIFTFGAGTPPHAPLKVNRATIGYDDNGNMTGDGSRTLAWDGANRLSRVTRGSASTTFAYGPDGSRVKKTGAFASTWYPSPDVEIDATSLPLSASDFTRYPHPDIKLVGTGQRWLGLSEQFPALAKWILALVRLPSGLITAS